METQTKETRNRAIRSLQHPERKRDLILRTITKKAPCSSQEVATITGIAINVVVARINELANDLVRIKPAGTVKNIATKNPNTLWIPIKKESERRGEINKKLSDLTNRIMVHTNDLKTGMSRISLDLLKDKIQKLKKKRTKLEKL